jgi:glucosamine--fructose-6-phosphate aminotransferase (isomerizing)
VLSGGGPTVGDTDDLLKRLSDMGAPLATVSPAPHSTLPLPARLPEVLQPIAATVRGQQLALASARVRGFDPDRPEGLSKITLTR